jgi:hypothetical protein
LETLCKSAISTKILLIALPAATPMPNFFKRSLLITVFLLKLSSVALLAQQEGQMPDLKKRQSLKIEYADSTAKQSDSLIIQPIITDTVSPSISDTTNKKQKRVIDSKVQYSATDSVRLHLPTKKMYLYGDAQVDYEQITLKAAYMELDMNSKIIYARGVIDSTGKEIGKPEFTDKGQSFTSKEMSFNFETKKGLIKDVITKEGDGYIHGQSVKKMDTNEMYIKSGKYTTCDNPEPHFHIHATRLKIIPEDKIITGPAYLAIENVPTPLALPFGFFPNKKGQSSGLILPQYGESQAQGFFLNNGGYYFAINDKVDFSLLGDIYSKGSWAVGGMSNYNKRYKYNGNFNARFSRFSFGERMLRDFPVEEGKPNPFFQVNKDFLVRWNHRQDPKARPNSVFSANVNAGTSNYNRLNSFGSNNANFLTSSLQSNIMYAKSWPGKPFNLTLNGSHSQNTITGETNITLPQAVFNVNRVFLFKRKIAVGEQKWFEKIGVTYVGNLRNEINTNDSLLFTPQSLNNMRNGVMHQATISSSYKAFKYFSVNPNISLTDRWYIKTIDQYRFQTSEIDTLITDTIKGFRRAGDLAASVNMTTTIYGMYQFKRGPVKAIRHVLTPSVGFTYRPETNFWGQETIIRGVGPNNMPFQFSPYQLGAFGTPSVGQQGMVNFNLINNLEAKVRSSKDTITGFTKIKIFENINFGASHNIFAEEFKWTPMMINGRTRLLNNVDLLFGGAFDPYALGIDTLGRVVRVNEFLYNRTGQLGRLTDAQLAVNFSLRSKKQANANSLRGTQDELDRIYANPNAYVDFNIPWNLSIAYVMRYSSPLLTSQFTQSLQFFGDFNLTPKWKFGFNSGYDFVMKDFTYTTLNIYRDLHCWEMVFNWVPFGQNKSYTVDIRVKSPVLSDLKLTRRRSWFDM